MGDIPKCEECGASGGHSPFCEKQTVDQIKSQLKRYYTAWLDRQNNARASRDRLLHEIVFWQGKCAMLKHENNQLRKIVETKCVKSTKKS